MTKQVRNKTPRPLKVPLGQGKILHLGPGATGEVNAAATERPGFWRLVEEGQLEVLGESGQERSGAPGESPREESTHGHPQKKVILPKGNR